ASWDSSAGDPALRPLLLRRRAERATTDRDVPRADSLWSELARGFPLWAPAALRARVDLALSRSDPARAESLLAGADEPTWVPPERARWTEPERADLRARRAALRLDDGDAAGAAALA